MKRHHSIIDDLVAFEEFLDARSRKEKEKERDKKKEVVKGHTFTFAEGMIMAYVAQFLFPPLYKMTLIHFGVQ